MKIKHKDFDYKTFYRQSRTSKSNHIDILKIEKSKNNILIMSFSNLSNKTFILYLIFQ